MKTLIYISIFAIFASCSAEQRAARADRAEQKATRQLERLIKFHPEVFPILMPDDIDTNTTIITKIVKDTIFIKGDTEVFINEIDTSKKYQNFIVEDSIKIVFVEVIREANKPPQIITTVTVKEKIIYRSDTIHHTADTITKTKTITKTVTKTPSFLKILFSVLVFLLVFYLVKSQNN
jgi:hypothetical protein